MSSEWWMLYSLLAVSIGTNYCLIHKLNRANKLIDMLQTVIRALRRRHDANRQG